MAYDVLSPDEIFIVLESSLLMLTKQVEAPYKAKNSP